MLTGNEGISFQFQNLKSWGLQVGFGGIQFSVEIRDVNEEIRKANVKFQNLAKAAPYPTTYSWSSGWPEDRGG